MVLGRFHGFLASEAGAVTVDWVVLSAIAIGFGLMVMTTLQTGTTNVGTQIEENIGAVTVMDVQQLGFSQ